MYIKLNYKKNNKYKKKYIKIDITGSKSETNRLLIIKKLYNNIKLYNLSNSNDTKLMLYALKSNNNIINVKDAGTVMRFLISYFSIQNKKITILTGTKRMKQRPIYNLILALKQLDCNIKYLKHNGYPPIKIIGKKIIKNKIKIKSNISSQFISSLILIGSKLKNGLIIKLLKNKISLSYIYMTINILKKLNFKINIKNNYIFINNLKKIKKKKKFLIESDWSSASYFYLLLSVFKKKKIILTKFKKKSYQGDSIISYIYNKYFGIKTKFKKKNNIIIYNKKKFKKIKYLKLNLKSTPDIAQTIIVTCSILKIKCLLKGLDTLKIKETDRLIALKNELKKIGTYTKITNNSIEIIKINKIPKKKIIINTYNDHRMAMSFSAFSLKRNIIIENPKTVKKSYPNFWKDLKKIGINIKFIK
ncbi:MAG: 3-phosphoshikimate 1-carboxyvinyltransferase [Candidatus Shikimatogenerans sp. JK-2022]|nr:3-phosphoshikimate 1-carboxyvinyltransferase [Candidatus Shikimatogenerans bostrichidophilus]